MKKEPTEIELIDVNLRFAELAEGCVNCQSESDQQLIQQAFKFAYEAHYGIARNTGEPYIIHPIAVAKIIGIELRMDALSVVCSLLHDVVEDTKYTLQDIETLFGEKAKIIVNGLTNSDEIYDQNSNPQAEVFKKLLLSFTCDIRIILIKLADRLHNMRTLHGMIENKQLQKAGEVLYIYAPLAHRLGIHSIKAELEELSFEYRHPSEFKTLTNRIEEIAQWQRNYLGKVKELITDLLLKAEFDFRIFIRQRTTYSVWRKMNVIKGSISEVPDLLVLEIIVKTTEEEESTDCWKIYGLLQSTFTIDEKKIVNYIHHPRTNGYEALHCMLSYQGKWIGFHIMSERMFDIAERGFPVQKYYKKYLNQKSEIDKWIDNLKKEIRDQAESAIEFLDKMKINLYPSDIFVFTPKGHIRTIPVGSTVLDFAYEIHRDMGKKCIGAYVNHESRKIDYVLESGDEVKIITSENQRPRIEWFTVIVTLKALNLLKQYFRKECMQEIENGKILFLSILREKKLEPEAGVFEQIKEIIPYKFKEELFIKISRNIISKEDIRLIFNQKPETKFFEYPVIKIPERLKSFIGIKKISDTPDTRIDKNQILKLDESFEVDAYKLATCCNPIPGDEVIGYQNLLQKIIIHRADCKNAVKVTANSNFLVFRVEWTTHAQVSFLTRIRIKGNDRQGLLKEIATVISDEFNVNMKKVQINTEEHIFEGIIDLYVHNIFITVHFLLIS
jgi:GTP pyrophosphokinase